jgi:hypothetical protein
MELLASKLRNKVFGVTFLCGNIQGDTGGKVSILGGDNIGQCEGGKRVHIKKYQILNGYRDRWGRDSSVGIVTA